MCLTDPYSLFHFSLQIIGYLGGGFKYFHFRPQKLWKWSNLTVAYFFQMGGNQPPTTTYKYIVYQLDTQLDTHGLVQPPTRLPFYFRWNLAGGFHVFSVASRGFAPRSRSCWWQICPSDSEISRCGWWGQTQIPSPRFCGARGGFFPRFGLFLADFQFVKIIFLLYQVVRRIYQTQ